MSRDPNQAQGSVIAETAALRRLSVTGMIGEMNERVCQIEARCTDKAHR
jgi:hypothetical protein